MSSSVESSRGWAGAGGNLVRSLLLLAVLIPVTALFVQVRQAATEKVSFAEKERHGVQYLTALWQVTLALADAQSAAVGGRTPAADTLDRAVTATADLDQRLGDELRTHERWSGLRAKIEALPGRSGSAAYSAYTEASDLLLALYGKVRENSELIRDPDADAYYLEDGAAEELPEAVIAAGRLVDLAVLAPTRPESERTDTVATLTVARNAVTDPAGDLTADLRSAVDGTESRTLSGNLLSRLDLFQRNMDKLTSVNAPGDQSTLDTATLTSTRTQTQDAAAALGSTIFSELDALVENRIGDLNGQRRLALATYVLAVLLVLAPVAIMFLSRRPRRDPGAPLTTRLPRPSARQPEWERSGAAR